MICMPGQCIKSGKSIMAEHGRPNTCYSEIGIELDTGYLLRVGVHSEENLESLEEANEALRACNEYWGLSGFNLPGKAVKLHERVGYLDILKQLQGGRCAVTGEALGDHWVHTNGQLRKENV